LIKARGDLTAAPDHLRHFRDVRIESGQPIISECRFGVASVGMAEIANEKKRFAAERSLGYMGLKGGDI
jgi:hypothetical protein